MVVQLERQPGQKEPRWMQLLESDAEGRAAAAALVPAGGGGSRSSRGVERVEPSRVDDLEHRVQVLETQLAALLVELGIEPASIEPVGTELTGASGGSPEAPVASPGQASNTQSPS
jgi:hypothetical protein